MNQGSERHVSIVYIDCGPLPVTVKTQDDITFLGSGTPINYKLSFATGLRSRFLT